MPVDLPELSKTFERIAEEWGAPPSGTQDGTGLTVQVHSFSFRRGYPEDVGGHGGFVFDCRALPNPGRHEEYRRSTGRGADVAAYLEAEPETGPFWDHVRGLVEAQIEVFLTRGFSSLSVAFGCTGGQHRSVYLAEKLARHLGARHPDVKVRVAHREEPYWPSAEAPAETAAAATWMP
jgi:RNase adaptor protein for sRNA GlmZ degradation